MKRDEVVGGIIVFLFGGVTTILSLKMPIGTFRTAGAGLFPLSLGILLMVLSALFLISLASKQRMTSAKSGTAPQTEASTKQMILFLGVMVFAVLCFNMLGYPLTAFFLMVSLLRVLGTKRWFFAVMLSLAVSIGSYMLFVQWLKIPLPKGWIGL